MESIIGWVISICGICILSVLIDLFLPHGEMSGQIRTIFNFFIILVIVMPLPSLIKNSTNQTVIDYENISIQDEYIYQLNRDKLDMLEQNITTKLDDIGLKNVGICIYADIFVKEMIIENVFVDLTNLVIQKNAVNINIKNEVVNVITSQIKIDKEKIIFDNG